jgi:hypothetical protein
MDFVEIEIAGELEQGHPLWISAGVARIPPEAIDEHELVYRVRHAPDVDPGDLLIVEPRNTAFTGELVLAFREANIFLGRWWAKHGLRELHLTPERAITGEFQIAGAVTVIVRGK